mmetsp:Transcript_51892/g.121399  ORF Transcript_51892/g.121399 Transcript_51892/m.121399 type:complete len:106 (+) Transcript_51892:1552-1869(+)
MRICRVQLTANGVSGASGQRTERAVLPVAEDGNPENALLRSRTRMVGRPARVRASHPVSATLSHVQLLHRQSFLVSGMIGVPGQRARSLVEEESPTGREVSSQRT